MSNNKKTIYLNPGKYFQVQPEVQLNPISTGGGGDWFHPQAFRRTFPYEAMVRGGCNYTLNSSFVITEHLKLVSVQKNFRGIYSCIISYCLPEFYFKRFYILPEFWNTNYLMSQYFSINNPSFLPFRGIYIFLQEFTLFFQSIMLPNIPSYCLIFMGYHNLPLENHRNLCGKVSNTFRFYSMWYISFQSTYYSFSKDYLPLVLPI